MTNDTERTFMHRPDDLVQAEVERAVRQLTWPAVAIDGTRQARGDVDVWARCERCNSSFGSKTPAGHGPVITVAGRYWDELVPPAEAYRVLVPGERHESDEDRHRRERTLSFVANSIARRVNSVRCGCSGGA